MSMEQWCNIQINNTGLKNQQKNLRSLNICTLNMSNIRPLSILERIKYLHLIVNREFVYHLSSTHTQNYYIAVNLAKLRYPLGWKQIQVSLMLIVAKFLHTWVTILKWPIKLRPCIPITFAILFKIESKPKLWDS